MKKPNLRYLATLLVIIAVFGIAYIFTQQDTASSKPGPIAWKSFNEGVALAQSSNKKILVDAYTDWCSWCKKMDAEVYTNTEVVKILNKHFVAVKLNAESNNPVSFGGNTYTEAEFAHQLGVTGYPTTLFFDKDSNPITDFAGYAVSDRFARVLDFIGRDYYKTTSFQEYMKTNPPLP
jgi:thioredoxin-related protein